MSAAAEPSASMTPHHMPTTGVADPRRWPYCFILVCALFIVPQALALQTTQEHLDRGYALLVQARHTQVESQHEQRLSAAVDAFSQAYQQAGQGDKVHALVGAAQAYLLMRKAPAVFPFLWSAPPLQRAERSLQQALILQPDSRAAVLLMGLTLWRQAETAAASQHQSYQRSLTYLTQAAALGIPIQLPSTSADQPASGLTPLSVHDTVLVVRAVDARGTGSPADLLLAYRTSGTQSRCYGVVVSAGKAYPLTTSLVNGTMALAVNLDDLKIAPGPHNRPMVVAVVQQDGHQVEKRFVWNASRFVFIGERPMDS